jgi:hypothetical protein
VSSGSNRKFWWQDALGHEWFTTVNARKAGQGCPFCAGKKVLVGFNDLGTTNPKLATEWHHKNTVPFDSVTSKSSVKVWWQCEKNHEWQAPVYSRSNGNNCPYCAGKKTTYVRGILLVDKHPEIAKNFSTKNLISFEQVTLYEKTKYLWVCDFGHEWQGLPSIFRNGYTCPICKGKKVLPGVNDIATTHPEKVRRFWSFNKNSISPSEVSAGSDKRVWWVCEKGHDWQGTPNEVLGRNRGCPACAGKVIVAGDNDLRTLYPDIAEQWHPEKNKSLTPSKVTPGANKKIWWQCEKGHEWEAFTSSAFDIKEPLFKSTRNFDKSSRVFESKLKDKLVELQQSIEESQQQIEVTLGNAKPLEGYRFFLLIDRAFKKARLWQLVIYGSIQLKFWNLFN